eukprot:CAMPEP_0197659876 /NCGR_PEP_ID=MMETSP1338-20131121/49546_1 /TAXON_ID=43686 ORGANISM="Pelagodinium beii, Strain RCC1491" /NCGR_SAMPLE_ID=MMETSP1338 /ASSEMBLY_ACC=CAM_ASM_000754 /LENGTH=827 /DNA_ID=CAMNT_0043237037 /DNA_START=119 /DNA_END=2602 /DNA_ORIENTATION=-
MALFRIAPLLATAAAIEVPKFGEAVVDSHGEPVMRHMRNVRETDRAILQELGEAAELSELSGQEKHESIFDLNFTNGTVQDVVNQTLDQLFAMNASETTIAQAMRVKLDGKGDTRALASTALFSIFGMACILASFRTLRVTYPTLYSKRELERITSSQDEPKVASDEGAFASPIHDSDDEVGPSMLKQLRSTWRLQDDCVIEVAGLDACMHLQFQVLALRVLISLMVIPAVLCPLHWMGAPEGAESFAAVSWTVHEDRYGVLCLHCITVWYVVLITIRHLFKAQEQFLPMRYAWLKQVKPPQATTVIVEGIPENLRTDARLGAYFSSLFPENAVLRSYVVRRTKLLASKLARLEEAQQACGRALSRLEAVTAAEQLKNVQEEVTAEHVRLGRAADAFDPDACTNCGIITFRSHRDVRLALREQLATDCCTLSLKVAPAPEDIWYDSFQMPQSKTVGWLCILGIFTFFSPCVVLVSSLVRLNSLARVAPVVADLKENAPGFAAMLEGLLTTMALNALMAVTPWMFYLVSCSFFRPFSFADVQVKVQGLYFTFLAFFILLVTTFTQGVMSTLWLVAQQPTHIVHLLATSLPTASHFYVNYLVVGWLSCIYELIRLFPLLKFISYKEHMGSEEARQKAETESVELGSRVGKSVLMLLICIVYCSLCPVALIFGAIYFLLERVSHGYLCYYAEPKQPDLGGKNWVQALQQVHIGLVIYVLLMVGVLGASGIEFIICLVPSLYVIANSWLNLNSSFLWESLPLDGVFDQDGIDELKIAEGQEQLYEQPEVMKCRQVLKTFNVQTADTLSSGQVPEDDPSRATEDTDSVSLRS